jgi:CheY-like chemotaxis protein
VRALIVDDNATNGKFLQHQLDSWRMPNESAAGGREALDKLGAAPYDLVLLDMQMPEMEGLELARAIKADPRIARVKLVLLTSIVDRDLAETSRAAGCAAMLTKPVSPSAV